ncbi:conjugal transfer protein [Enterococcus faecalis]|uniref:conjugal transfer protein n=1 Tax=Enterococcus faecalis TaxID=1351 RepID=UPI0013D68D5B|nr:conjugal transfer protein [Enterococcus faecalis]EJM6036342.1 conjugal transfer protein [Enterococcus faecalis]NFA63738.1 conjugal transfer protein [Enterococcus faecalis]HAP3019603.1 conjugal transfer protein [Enterococcus faecalis]
MKIKIERSEKAKKSKKQKKIPVIKIGVHRKLTIILWVLLIGSVSFGFYKNLTAVDKHTVHEKEIVEQRVVDTNRIESYVESFAIEYFSWQQSQDAINKRNEHLKNYFTEELRQLNIDMIRTDIPTSSVVSKVQIWNVSKLSNTDFEVLFSVEQQLTEGKNKKKVSSSYSTVVYMDEDRNMVIIKNPTMNSKPQKSEYQPKQIENNGTVDTIETAEISSFLETFFKLYPKADEKELAYYISNNSLPTIKKNYVFVELINPIYSMKENKVMAVVTVKYLDQVTKATLFSQYQLVLEKVENWKIVSKRYK